MYRWSRSRAGVQVVYRTRVVYRGGTGPGWCTLPSLGYTASVTAHTLAHWLHGHRGPGTAP